jgi:hypothetical protein
VLGAGGGVGVVGVAFVSAGFGGCSAGFSPQPVIIAPITSPNSTIRVDSLFIVRVTLTDSKNLTSKKIISLPELFRIYANGSEKQANVGSNFCALSLD